MKAGGEGGNGPAVDVPRGATLFHHPVVEHREAVGHRQGLFLVVGHINGGEPGLFADAPDFGAHLQAEFGVEIGQRFIEQQALGMDHQGPGQSHPLLLSAGKLVGFVIGAVGHFHHGQGLFHPARRFRLSAILRISNPKATFWATLMCGQSA
jgi:hypothetical protein